MILGGWNEDENDVKHRRDPAQHAIADPESLAAARAVVQEEGVKRDHLHQRAEKFEGVVDSGIPRSGILDAHCFTHGTRQADHPVSRNFRPLVSSSLSCISPMRTLQICS